MRMMKAVAMSLGLVAVTISSVSASIIDFEDLGVATGTQLNPAAGVSQDTGGFTITPGPINISGLNDLHFHNEDGDGNNGTTHLGTHDDVVITKIGGGTFSIVSFDFEGFRNESGGGESGVTVVGFISGGGTVGQTITPDGNPFTYQNFTLTGFDNLTSVAFNYLGDGAFGFFLDNINTSSAAVPEPGTLALLGLGLAALVRRRVRR